MFVGLRRSAVAGWFYLSLRSITPQEEHTNSLSDALRDRVIDHQTIAVAHSSGGSGNRHQCKQRRGRDNPELTTQHHHRKHHVRVGDPCCTVGVCVIMEPVRAIRGHHCSAAACSVCQRYQERQSFHPLTCFDCTKLLLLRGAVVNRTYLVWYI